MRRSSKNALIFTFTALALIACEKKAEADPAKPAAKPAEAKPTEKAQQAAKPAAKPAEAKPAEAKAEAKPEEKNYLVKVIPGEATAGQPATTIVQVTPTPGYKMNLEFPSKMKLTANDKVTAPKLEFSGPDAEITEQALKFKVAYTANAAGKVDLAGAADFSVCNENACKLIRGEEVAWAVNVK